MVAVEVNSKSSGRLASAYNEVQTSHLHHALPLPSVLYSLFSLIDRPPNSATGNSDEIAKLFPNLFGQLLTVLMLDKETTEGKPLKVGVVLSGRQAPSGDNVYAGDFHRFLAKGGFDMICSGRDKIETPEQFKQA
ncbi:pyrophosphate--fructose 6-phosphate 1-phosphotransferase subunit beta-like [Phragmites australis]|uniref:pyrophosphate--fructose 6-phosphate 1-phosphotransferase subunit beta-like n=1 Tax=Phragmites australis TaxID=29695 RepID=UPI002D7A1E09|nr:pyrophosphate--fructose 6-phosphate 1-phosphotransferase subunit beta-like [Phragmites australis]